MFLERVHQMHLSFIFCSLWEVNIFFCVCGTYSIVLLYIKRKNRDLVMTPSVTVKLIVTVSYLQAHKSAFYSFMEAGRVQRLLGQRQREFITNGTMSILSFMFAFVPLDLQVPWMT